MSDKQQVVNPHFDHDLVVWRDEYSGRYMPPSSGYAQEFELQWKLALQRTPGYFANPGACTDDEYIKDRVLEWTGIRPDSPSQTGQHFHSKTMGVKRLDVPVPVELIRDKRCIDIGCGLGRWTRAMQMLGAAKVLSIDMSESALASVSAFNDWVERVDIMTIPQEHPEWVEQFDFANFWGVAMCTHDPKQAFMSAASTVTPGGALYLMVYSPEGMHNTSLVKTQRNIFHRLNSVEERMRFVQHVRDRRWDWRYSIVDNLVSQAVRVYHRLKGKQGATLVGVLDMLEPFYNWVIPLDVIEGWIEQAGFRSFQILNHGTRRVAYHVLATK
jgi:SAM-dependent methyltransferase